MLCLELIMINLLKIKWSFKFDGKVFNNESCGTSFIKGGAAREILMQTLGENIDLKVRDLDLYIDEEDRDSDISWIQHLHDGRSFYRDSIEYLLQDVDVNINKVLLAREGIYYHIDAYIGIKKKVIWRDSKSKAGKRAIRAHFFALRYGYTVADQSFIDPYHNYLDTSFYKASQLGLYEEWKAYLIKVCNIEEDSLPKKIHMLYHYIEHWNLCYWNDSFIIHSFHELTHSYWDEATLDTLNTPSLQMGNDWVKEGSVVIEGECGKILILNKSRNQLFIGVNSFIKSWLLYDNKTNCFIDY